MKPFALIRSGVLAIVLAMSGGAAWAQEKKSGEWEYDLVPLYLWGMSIDGSTRMGPVTAPLNIRFKDAVEDLSGVFTFYFEGHNARWGYYTNFSWIKLTPDSELPTGRTVSVDFRNPLIEVAGLYRLGEPGRSPWWLVGGVRYMGLHIDVTGIPSPPLPFNSLNAREDITDGFIGGRFRQKLSDRWELTAQGDVGTGTSDLVWSASALFNYRFNKTVGALAGWRWLDYDVNKTDFVYDAMMSGPILAVTFHW